MRSISGGKSGIAERITMYKKKFTREELIDICEKAIVKHDEWHDRYSSAAQGQVGRLWAYLKAGCRFTICLGADVSGCQTDENTIWLDVYFSGFAATEAGDGELGVEGFYLPQPGRLADVKKNGGGDWY